MSKILLFDNHITEREAKAIFFPVKALFSTGQRMLKDKIYPSGYCNEAHHKQFYKKEGLKG